MVDVQVFPNERWLWMQLVHVHVREWGGDWMDAAVCGLSTLLVLWGQCRAARAPDATLSRHPLPDGIGETQTSHLVGRDRPQRLACRRAEVRTRLRSLRLGQVAPGSAELHSTGIQAGAWATGAHTRNGRSRSRPASRTMSQSRRRVTSCRCCCAAGDSSRTRWRARRDWQRRVRCRSTRSCAALHWTRLGMGGCWTAGDADERCTSVVVDLGWSGDERAAASGEGIGRVDSCAPAAAPAAWRRHGDRALASSPLPSPPPPRPVSPPGPVS
mmetsp:Transcript_11216/g.35729  ORF Transcript_11216/g.35729 Transcript_11216/m.35729 type:complete len:271 (+) Transcript_11216:321-1133(+)